MSMNNKKLAVLIDADNTSHKNIGLVLQEIARYGTPIIKRVYGDWSSEINENGKPTNRLHVWRDVSLAHAITPIQQFAYTKGKDATDMMLIINAMDLLYGGALDGFCIMSSDSDFTPLASRIRENGLIVYGFGKKQTPNAFINACDKFIYIENLDKSINDNVLESAVKILEIQENDKSTVLNQETVKKTAELKDNSTIAQTNDIKKTILINSNQEVKVDEQTLKLIYKAIKDIADDDGWANLSTLGNHLVVIKPDFDTRTYGRAKLSGLLQALDLFQIKQENSQKFVRKKPSFSEFLKVVDSVLRTHYGVGQWAKFIALDDKIRIDPSVYGFSSIQEMLKNINSKYFEVDNLKTQIRLLK